MKAAGNSVQAGLLAKKASLAALIHLNVSNVFEKFGERFGVNLLLTVHYRRVTPNKQKPFMNMSATKKVFKSPNSLRGLEEIAPY